MPPDIPAREQLLTAVRAAVRGRAGIAAAYLYGSAERERTTSLSDVDVGLLFSDPTMEFSERLRVASEVASQVTGRHPGLRIDVRDVEDLPLAVVGPMLVEGRLAGSNHEVRRVSFERDTRRRYFDFLPVHEREVEEGLEGLRRRFGRG